MSRKTPHIDDPTPGEEPKARRASGDDASRTDAAPESAETTPDADDSATVQSPDDAPRTGDSSTAGKRKLTKLPSFGFAADLLGRRDDPDAAETVEPAVEASAAANADFDEGPIFSFADTLTATEREAEQRAAEARITTWITFGLADETFALPVEPVREVLRIHNITRVPHAPAPIRGVTNLRGRVIPVIDLRRRIGLPEGDLGRSARIIVVSSRGRLIGLLVDLVQQVTHLDLNLVQSPPDDVMTLQSDYISGVYHMGEDLLLLLDVDRALTIREASQAQLSGAA